MTQRTNIVAFTELDYAPEYYPGFISVNRETDGKVSFTVRSRGQGGNACGTLPVDREQARRIAQEILAALKDEPNQ